MRKGSAVSEPAYLQLDPDVEQAIAENLRCGRMHPRSFPDEQALRREDSPHDAATPGRSSCRSACKAARAVAFITTSIPCG